MIVGKIVTSFVSIVLLITLMGCSEECRVAQLEAQNKAMVQRIHAEVSKGNMGIFDYYNMQNIKSDTSMRESISDMGEEGPKAPEDNR